MDAHTKLRYFRNLCYFNKEKFQDIEERFQSFQKEFLKMHERFQSFQKEIAIMISKFSADNAATRKYLKENRAIFENDPELLEIMKEVLDIVNSVYQSTQMKKEMEELLKDVE